MRHDLPLLRNRIELHLDLNENVAGNADGEAHHCHFVGNDNAR
jgi:hypothetical protein